MTDQPSARPAVLFASAAMERAIYLASLGPAWGPNPRVGCVIMDAAGRVLGEGFHHGAGTPHAEVMALRDAEERGMSVFGAVAYVTLEPCSHHGRTGPCTEALDKAGIGGVRYAAEDPNPSARGGGDILRASGIAAMYTPHSGAREINRRWLHALRQGRPYVIAKWAATLDGRTAAADGTSFWITGEPARAHAHAERARAGAIVVGTGTVLDDDPELSARPFDIAEPHQPLRVVMGQRQTPGAKVWRDGNAWAAHTHDPAVVLEEMQRREIHTVIVEGGSTVTTAFLAAGLVDEINAYIAPAILGSGPSAVAELGISTMSDALRGADVTHSALGADTLVTALIPPKGT